MKSTQRLPLLLSLSSSGCASLWIPTAVPSFSRHHGRSTASRHPGPLRSAVANLDEPDAGESNFGRQAYWDDSYRQETATTPTGGDEKGGDNAGDVFSWYCGWTDELGPFFEELVPDRDALVLVPGIGNDAAIRDMFDVGGYQRLAAFDYAPQGVARAKAMFGDARLRTIAARVGTATRAGSESERSRDAFRVCDARDLTAEYEDDTFDAMLDKGTFDAIYLSGGKDKAKAKTNLSLAVAEMKRVIKDGGIVFSVTAACVAAVQGAFQDDDDWQQLRDGSLHITADGYASNNVDATMLAWRLISTT